MDVTTVADDLVVLHDGITVHRFDGLEPGMDHLLNGVEVTTLERPPGHLLCRFGTVNDVHFGETRCGVIEGMDAGPVLEVDEGERPYPETMNDGAVREMLAGGLDAVVVKGDLTAEGTDAEYQSFLRAYGVFGDRLVHVRGNHDAYHGQTYAAGPQVRDLPGVRVVVLDTARPAHAGGWLPADQLELLDDAAGESDRPVVVMMHHHVWSPDDGDASVGDAYFGIRPVDSEALVGIVAKRPTIVGLFSGHTHRNRLRQFRATGEVPFVEVACTKDFPGVWAEYRVFEGGLLQVQHRISTPEALLWSERCRQLYANVLDYSTYALGRLSERCFTFGVTR